MEGIKNETQYEKRLSIIVPVYNVEKYLERCVESLLHQDLPKEDYEIILVNDGSTDGSYKICQEQCEMHENIVSVSLPNKGQGEARNTGINMAKGRYLMFVDSDDELFPNVIGQMLHFAERNSLDVAESRMMVQSSNGSERVDFVQPFPSNRIFSGEQALLQGVHVGSVCTNLYSHEFLNANSLRFSASIYHEDVEFNLKMYAYAKRIMFLEVMSYYYRYNPTSTDRERTRTKIVHSYRSEFKIAKSIKEFANTTPISPDLRLFYNYHENSSIVSCLLRLVKEHNIDKKNKIELLEELKKSGLYPIYGRTLSWKTTFLITFLNKEWLYRVLLQVGKF